MIRIKKRAVVMLCTSVLLVTLFLVKLITSTSDNHRNMVERHDFRQENMPIESSSKSNQTSLKATTTLPEELRNLNTGDVNVNENVHVFYYAWYGSPVIDGSYMHWNHRYLPHWKQEISNKYPTGERHVPPNDLSSVFYPALGPYSSRDVNIVHNHMEQIKEAGIGVVALSWYPPGMADEEGRPFHAFVMDFLDIAGTYELKVSIHMEPFKGNTSSILAALEYIHIRYGKHPALYRRKTVRGVSVVELPVIYFYDSYQISNDIWKSILLHGGDYTIRKKWMDVLAIGLIVEKKHMQDLYSCGFDGMYSYFASDGFSFGSSQKHWNEITTFAINHNMMFVPSVGPGYDDTRIRPWNDKNTKIRDGGNYYKRCWESALKSPLPPMISITSFNEWQEGTQIEAATDKLKDYQSYKTAGPLHYLHMTKQWSMVYKSKLKSI